MNIFRLAGDMTHLLSIIVLLLKIRTMKSCAGISLKTQELYAIVFLARYLDLFMRYLSLYNTVMKLVFIATSICIVWYMRFHRVVKQTYNKDQDTFPHYFLLPPCFLLALLIHPEFTVIEVLWTFSIYLEAVAILPQLLLLQRSKNIDNLTGKYVFLLGAYRALYLVNWIYRFFMENHRFRWIPWLSGLVQTALYADFFYYYIKSHVIRIVLNFSHPMEGKIRDKSMTGQRLMQCHECWIPGVKAYNTRAKPSGRIMSNLSFLLDMGLAQQMKA